MSYTAYQPPAVSHYGYEIDPKPNITPSQQKSNYPYSSLQEAVRRSTAAACGQTCPDLKVEGPPAVKTEPSSQQINPTVPSLELVSSAGESAQYVNAKQFHRILKRRVARQRFPSTTPKVRKSYLHESRHIHSLRRPRGQNGRFLTADQIATMQKGKEDGNEEVDKSQETPVKVIKRKAHANTSTSNKKARQHTEFIPVEVLEAHGYFEGARIDKLIGNDTGMRWKLEIS